ncbi:DUF1120 domain-containing protein [Serratia liquefaciens]|jgi:hypothetical protein|uniref:DUF1120 domain-containing protein n=1 Tax=Serratia liquefaciens TaxID=614 RepID=UPI00061B6DD5|nr:DUF1120 domain-containing protein [Serratia liquefaciens]AKE08968.1 hypothetical protein XJ20_03275 [Serratia liquefaciens]
MKKMQITACALAVLTITSLPSYAKDIEVKVAGTITPAGCNPTLPDDGVIDYGMIKSDYLTLDAYSTLEIKDLVLTITCDAPVKLALEAKNGRPNTLAGVATEDAISGAALAPVGSWKGIFGLPAVVGLGLSNSARIGGYWIRASIMTADGTSAGVGTLERDGNSGKWTYISSKSSANNLYSIGFKRQISWGRGAMLEPEAFKNVTINLRVKTYINKASELDLTKPIILDGLTTLELIYL